jgi:hypothetical protein
MSFQISRVVFPCRIKYKSSLNFTISAVRSNEHKRKIFNNQINPDSLNSPGQLPSNRRTDADSLLTQCLRPVLLTIHEPPLNFGLLHLRRMKL